jgi:hypothetical protein
LVVTVVAMTTAAYLRDAAMTAVIFGFFGSAWFGWAQEAPPARWSVRLAAGSILSLATAVGGGVVAWQHWSDGTIFGPDTGRNFGIVVGIEFAVTGLGALVLALRRRRDLIPPWVAFVVGVHLFPVAAILQYPMIYLVASLVTVVSLIAVPVARSRTLAISFVTGLGTGLVLLAAAVYSLISALVWS